MDFDTLKDWVISSWRAQSEWREQVEDDFAFIDGHQWSDTEKTDLEEQSRIPVVFNRTAVIIGSVAGSEINNRTEVRFIPREIGDVKPNEVLTAGGEWFRDVADAEDAESESFQHLLVCGLGVTETTLDWEADPEGEPAIDAIDPLEFGWDCHARKKGLVDARYFFRVIEMPREEAESRFPDADSSEIDTAWLAKSGDVSAHVNVPGDEYAAEDPDEDDEKDTLRVVQIQWRERERVVEFVDPTTGKKEEMPQERFNKIVEKFGTEIKSRTVTRWIWYQAFLGKDGILDENQPDPERSTFHVMTGQWDRKDKRFYGLLRSMRDPQKFANKWLSQTLHIIGANAKGGVMVEEGAVTNIKDFEESWAASDSVTWLKDGSIASGRVKEKPGPQMPSALMALTEFAVTSIRDVSGVNMELLGLRDANQPGVLEYQRRQSAMTTMARYFDALRYYRKRQGHTILNFLRDYIAPTGRLVRLVKEDQVSFVPLAMDEGTSKYDVIIDDAPSAPNEKEKAWSVIEMMIPLLQQADLSLEDWADILEYSPLPSSFSDKVREKAKQAQNKPPSPQEELLKAEVALKAAQAQKAGAEAQSKAGEGQMKQAEFAQKNREIQANQQGVMLDMQSKKMEFQLDAQESNFRLMEMAHEREQWAHEERMAAIKERNAKQPSPAGS